MLVPLGARKVVGIVTGLSDSTEVAAGKLKSVLRVFHEVEPLRKEWLKTMAFAADYYLRPRGEAALSALPPFFDCPLRQPMKGVCRSFANSRRRRSLMNRAPVLNDEQKAAADAVSASTGYAPFMLFGVTGSGKTEVYLHIIERCLAKDHEAQVMLLVPEIN